MTWNKCSEKLPEVGMLIVYRVLWQDEYDYTASLVSPGIWVTQDDEEFTLSKFPEIEWKEVEKD